MDLTPRPPADHTPLVPRAVLFGNPRRSSPEISPDGRWLGYLAPHEGVLEVWVGPLDGSSDPVPVTEDRGRGIPAFGFCHDDRTLVYLQDEDGDEKWRLYRLDLSTGESHCVTPYDVNARILGHNRWHPTKMLLGLNKDNPELHDVYQLDLENDELELVERNPGFASWLVDSDLRVRGGSTLRPDGIAVIYLRSTDPTAEFVPWREVASDAVGGTDVIGFTREGDQLLLLTSDGADTARLVAVDPATGVEKVLAEDPGFDIGRVELDPETLCPQGVVFVKERDHWLWLDTDVGEQVAELRRRLAEDGIEGELAIGRSERSGRTWLVSVSPSDKAMRYYVHDRRTGRTTFLFSYDDELDSWPLSPMEPFSFRARDGLLIQGYLTFPLGSERGDLPAVLDVHGGPWSRHAWCYDPQAQWLANRGYLCVQVNFRGSRGYGRPFANAGDKEWGRRMHDDLIDAVSYCVEQGWVDRSRVGIMGSSYGGYAALVGAAFTPDVFRCAIDLCGPTNLLTMLESIPPYWKAMVAFMHARVGDPETERDMLWERSPLSRASDIRIPLLIGQGKHDPRVKQSEAEQIVAALVSNGLPHEYLLFENEGHGLMRPENRERFYATAERFLARHLQGRCESGGTHVPE